MRALLPLLALLALLLAAPSAAACVVTPEMRLDFPDNPMCTRFVAEGCIPMPAVGETVSFEGVLTWQWDMPGCAESAVPDEEVTIVFQELKQNPAWLTLSTDPEQIVVGPEDYQPEHLQPDTQTGTVRFILTFPLTATWTRDGAPSAGEARAIEDAGHQAVAHMRARSHESGDFLESTTVEQFLFDARPMQPVDAKGSEAAPGVAPLVAVLLVALAAAARRRLA